MGGPPKTVKKLSRFLLMLPVSVNVPGFCTTVPGIEQDLARDVVVDVLVVERERT